MKIGFIGLGKMGGGLARNLILAGNDVYLNDLNKEAVSIIQKDGGTAIDSTNELADQVDVLFTSLPLPKHLLDILIEGGLLKRMKRGSILVDVSTIDPTTAGRIKEAAQEYGVEFLACPLGKGPKQAYEGSLPIFIGGKEETFKKIKTILNQIGQPYYLGDVEQSTAFKLISNMIGMTNLLVMAEGLKMAEAADIDLQQFTELMKDTGGDSAQLHLRASSIINNQYEPKFQVDLALKDVRLGVEMAKLYGSKCELTDSTLKYMEKASQEGYGQEDCAAVFKSY